MGEKLMSPMSAPCFFSCAALRTHMQSPRQRQHSKQARTAPTPLRMVVSKWTCCCAVASGRPLTGSPLSEALLTCRGGEGDSKPDAGGGASDSIDATLANTNNGSTSTWIASDEKKLVACCADANCSLREETTLVCASGVAEPTIMLRWTLAPVTVTVTADMSTLAASATKLATSAFLASS